MYTTLDVSRQSSAPPEKVDHTISTLKCIHHTHNLSLISSLSQQKMYIAYGILYNKNNNRNQPLLVLFHSFIIDFHLIWGGVRPKVVV